MEYTITVPREDVEEAIRKGYNCLRVQVTGSVDGTVIDQRTQVRTGFNPDTGHETWEDLKDAKGRSMSGQGRLYKLEKEI